MGVYDAMWRSFFFSSVIAIIFVALVQIYAIKVIPWTIVIGGFFAVLFGLLVMLLSTGNILIRILFFLLNVGLAVGCAYTLFKPERMREIFVYARLM